MDIIYQTSSNININIQTGNDESTLNNFTTISDMALLRPAKTWLLIDWIFNATEVGKKFIAAVKCEHGKMVNEIVKKKTMRETAHTTGLNDEKPLVMDILIQNGDITRQEIVGEIGTIIFAATDTTFVASGCMLDLLGGNQQILEMVMQEQQYNFGDDILRPVGSDNLPRMVYMEQVGKCLLHSSVFSKIVAIFRHYIKMKNL